jgi:hypothetical protein
MSLNFIRLPFSVSRADLPSIDLSGAKPILGIPIEADAGGHWYLGANDGLLDLISKQPLTLQGAAPTYAANYATIAGGGGKALLTPWADSAVQTICMVVRRPTVAADAFFAGAQTTVAGDGGSGIFYQQSLAATARFSTRPFAGGAFFANWPANVPAGAFAFLAYSEEYASGMKRTALIGGGAASTLVDGSAKTVGVSTRKIAIGNGYYGTFTGSADVAEFIYYPGRALTEAEMQAVYLRSKDRMASRGLVLA